MIARPAPITQPGNFSSVSLEDSNTAETLWEYGNFVIGVSRCPGTPMNTYLGGLPYAKQRQLGARPKRFCTNMERSGYR